jgi:hypothetical protein
MIITLNYSIYYLMNTDIPLILTITLRESINISEMDSPHIEKKRPILKSLGFQGS